MNQTKIIERYFFFGLLLATLIFTFLVFRPFLPIIVISASFAVVLYPLYNWLQGKKIPAWLSSILTVVLFLIVICGPLFAIGIVVFNQLQDLYFSLAINGSASTFMTGIEGSINKVLPLGVHFDINQKVSELVSLLAENLATIFTSTLSTIFSIFLVIISLFLFLKDGSRWRRSLIALSPLNDKDDEKILKKLSMSINGIIKGYLLIAVIQGTLMGLGMAFFGVPNAALWGLIAAIGSLLPTIGTALISVPVVVFLFATGQTTEAIGMSIWAFAIVGWVDNLLNPMIIGKSINIPQILVLFSVLGGLALMGPIGFLIGPLTVSLLYTLLSIYKNEFEEQVNS